MSPVSTKYGLPGPYSNRGSWIIPETMSHGRVFSAFSVANLTYPKTTFQTGYSLVISEVNESLLDSYVRGFDLRLTALAIQDNYDGSTSSWGCGNSLADAVQATSIFNFRTSTVHEMRFTLSYELYDLFLLGFVADHSAIQSFNVTQSVL